MAQPEVHFKLTPSHFSIWPESLPASLPPPINERTLRAPFGINKSLYNFVLRPEIPIIFAALYMIVVLNFNAYNRRREHQSWSISKRKEFGYFVVVHNVLLALFSSATFLAMGRAIVHSLPAWDADNWNVRVADGLCKLHGPRGLGDSATFNTTINIWENKNTGMHLTDRGLPDPTDVGRLWNEGLAFWGWMFYMSKFYEVLDTFIVLAKGKRSGTLQTYHHAGAMLCMWAGIRYMSPPIWMFVFVNSGIHALMYTYFTLSALGYKVPQELKRVLTLMQIGQFIWGASYAAAHLFVQYDIPIETPFQVVHAVQRAASSASSAARSATSTISEVIESPAAATAIGSLIKKLLLRAAGEEGVAERVAYRQEDQLIPSAPQVTDKVHHFMERRFETQYRTDWTRINCIDTTGEAFAIYLNLLYLSPLTWLFLRFFSRAYSQRGKPRSASQAVHDAALSARDAKRETEASFERGGKKAEDEVAKRGSQAEEEVRKDVEKMKESYRQGRVSDDAKQVASDAQKKASDTAKQAKDTAEQSADKVKSSDAVQQAKDTAQTEADKIKNSDTAKQAKDTAESYADKVKGNVETSVNKIEESAKRPSSTNERTNSSTWMRGGGGLFRRSGTEDGSEKPKTEQSGQGQDTEQSEGNQSTEQSEEQQNTEQSAEGENEGEQGTAQNGNEADTAQSEETQDENLKESQDLRPDPEDDTDAMGKSGAIVDPKASGDGEASKNGL